MSGVRRSTVAVVAGLVGLSVPVLWHSIQKVRDAAARTQCYGRHHGLVLALHRYAETHGRLPNGTYPAAGVEPEDRLSWVLAVLPDVEMDGRRVFDQFDLSVPATDPRNVTAADARLRPLVCTASDEYRDDTWKSRPPVTYTVAVSGVGPDAASLYAGHPRAGLIGNDRGARLNAKEVPDGIGTTLLLAETGSSLTHWARGGWGTLRHLDPATRPHSGPGRTLGGLHVAERNWLAADTHATIIATADGSVRALGPNADASVLEAMATAAGGETMPAE